MDPDYYFLAGLDEYFIKFELSTQKKLFIKTKHSDYVNFLKKDSKSKIILSAGEDNKIIMRNLKNIQVLKEFRDTDYQYKCFDIMEDNRYLICKNFTNSNTLKFMSFNGNEKKSI